MSQQQARNARKKSRSGSEKRQRQPRIIFRVSKEERAAIKAAALAAGLTVGSFLRSLALAAPRIRAVRLVSPDRALINQFLGRIGRYEGNLYQLVKRANIGDTPQLKALDEIAQEAHEFLADARAVWKGA